MKKILFIVLLFPLLANARTFYFSSSTGNDSYDTIQAQNPATPWKTIYKINNFTVIRAGYIAPLFKAGDTLAFKRGDVFDNGANFTFLNGAVMWWDYNDGYYEAPSGTPDHPIVFTNYGSSSLPLPNFYYTLPAVTLQKNRNMFTFSGVHDIVVDGLQFNDTRFPASDKRNPAYTYSGILLGEWDNGGASDTSLRKRMVTNATVKNCIFSNMSFGLAGVAAINSNIINNTFTNFKATEDTIGFTDVMGGAIEGLSGFNINISNNYIKGAWSGSGRVSDCYGLGGVGLDIFWCFKNSRIAYNTFVDCSGVFEVGNRYNDSANGAQYDTFAYNKVINCGQLGYIHGTAGDGFAANNHNLYFWNNVVISNDKDRMNGKGFGDDLYNDGQGFASQFWFFRNKTLCPNDFERKGAVVNGSNIVTINTTNIQVGSRLYNPDEIAYKEVISVGSGQVTINAPFGVTDTAYLFRIYPPISDPNWSQPTQNVICNYGGYRSVLQYSSDLTQWGLQYDTLIDCRNNIFYATSGGQMIYPNLHGYTKQRYFHSNNIYYIKGGFVNPTALGGTLNTATGKTEQQRATAIFVDTTATYPENWDLHIANPTDFAVTGGTNVGYTTDFAGTPITGSPTIGLYQYVSAVSIPTISTTPANSISYTTALSGGNITSDGGSPVIRRGLMYSTNVITDTISGTKIIDVGTGIGSYTTSLTSLTSSTTYHVRAFAINSAGIAWGNDLTFVTLTPPTLATITTTAASSITGTAATSGGNVTLDGGSTVYRRGLIYSTSAITDTNSIVGGGKIISGTTGTGSFVSSLTSLTAGVTYHIRAFALNSVGVSYGSDLTFTTGSLPSLTTLAAYSITSNSAISGGNITSDGGSPIIRRGIVWNTFPITDTLGNPKLIDATNSVGSYNLTITSLTFRTYYVLAFAVNANGVAYGNLIQFQTLVASVPSVYYSGIVLGSTTATPSAVVSAEGSNPVVRKGFIYSTSPLTNDTTQGTKVAINSTGIGSYSIALSGLSLGTTYYLIPWASSSIGVGYGAMTTFITQNYPSVTTTSPTSITSSSAVSGGTITDYGATIVYRRAVIYSTSPISDTNSISGGGVVSFNGSATTTYSVNILSLLPNTTYYVRAFVVNTIGVGLGNQLTFTTTSAASLPIVTSSPVSSITNSSAIVGGDVKSDGNSSVYRRGFIYSTSPITDTTSVIGGGKIINGTGLGTYTSTLTSLTPATTYYFKAFALNSVGVSYSPELYFSTSNYVPVTNSFRTKKRFVQKL